MISITFTSPQEEEIVGDLALTNVLRLKFRVVQKMMEDNLKQVKDAEQKDDWDLLEKTSYHAAGFKRSGERTGGKVGNSGSKVISNNTYERYKTGSD